MTRQVIRKGLRSAAPIDEISLSNPFHENNPEQSRRGGFLGLRVGQLGGGRLLELAPAGGGSPDGDPATARLCYPGSAPAGPGNQQMQSPLLGTR